MQARIIRRTSRTIGYLALGVLAVGLSAIAMARAWPKAPLRALAPESTAISTENAELLRLTLAADGQFRLWVDLDQMPKRLPAAVLLYEDRWFLSAPRRQSGCARCAPPCTTASGPTLRCASTITMQLARRVYRLDTRSPLGKLRQIALALWLERCGTAST